GWCFGSRVLRLIHGRPPGTVTYWNIVTVPFRPHLRETVRLMHGFVVGGVGDESTTGEHDGPSVAVGRVFGGWLVHAELWGRPGAVAQSRLGHDQVSCLATVESRRCKCAKEHMQKCKTPQPIINRVRGYE